MNLKKNLKKALGEIYYQGLYRYIKPSGNRILIYHAFGTKLPHDTYGISIQPDLFKDHIKFIKEQYTVAPIADSTFDSLISNTISITIDDGYKDNLIAADILQNYNIPFTLYVSTGLINQPGYLSSQDLRDLSALKLCTLGAHGVFHKHLSKLSITDQEYELSGSKQFLEDCIGKEIRDFSYPYGDYNSQAKLIADNAYELISTSHIGINTRNCDKKMLKRVEIVASDTVKELNKKILGYYDYLQYRNMF